MSLLPALARAELQRQRHRPLDQVLHTLLAAIQHHTAQRGSLLAEVIPTDDGGAELRVRASGGCLRGLELPSEASCVQQALFGTASPVVAADLPRWPGGCGGVLLPLGSDGETHAVLALAGATPFPSDGPLAAEVSALGTIVTTWLGAERHTRADRRARRRLESAVRRYRAALHDALDAVLLVDPEGRVVEHNAQADRLLPGQAHWIGNRLSEHLDVPDLPPLGRHTFTLRAGKVPVEATVHQIPDGDGPLRVLVLRDTLEQRRAADALRDLNGELRRRVDELGRLNQENELLGELGAFLQASRDPAEVHAVVRRFAEALFGGRGALYLLEEGELERRAAWGDGALPQHLDAASCWALRRGELHCCEGGSGLPCEHSAPHEGITVCMPVMSASGPLGLLHLELPVRAPARPDRRERLLRAVADRLGAALTTLALQERLRQESIRDPLTRLYNRRYMVETMERELARARRASQPLAVVMLDVDHFKRLNDTYGHDVGDRVLQEVARQMTASVRAEDVVCRYGGEEFVIILPGATEALARARAEALREHLCLVGLHGRDGALPPVTVSAGVAMARPGLSPDRLLRLADEALLFAKETGRNKVVLASAEKRRAPRGISAA